MKVMIFGVTGQIGSYLAEHFLKKDFNVIGISRRVSTENTQNLKNILEHQYFNLTGGDITDANCVTSLLMRFQPDIIINCAAQSHVKVSFEQPSLTFDITAKGVLNILDAIRIVCPTAKMIQFSSSEMYGSCYDIKTDDKGNVINYQDEKTQMRPNSPYAASKLAAFNLVQIYRKAYHLNCSNIILFNTESPRRGKDFVTRKISLFVSKIYHEIKKQFPTFPSYKNNVEIQKFLESKKDCILKLGNIHSSRDWSHVINTVDAIDKMYQKGFGDDYVIATGETHTVEEFIIEAFDVIGFNNSLDWKPLISFDNNLLRPLEVPILCGLADKAKKDLNWKSVISFKELVSNMVISDISALKMVQNTSIY